MEKMNELCNAMMENIFDELKDCEKYLDMAERAQREENTPVFKKALETARQEMEHYDWQHAEIVSKIPKEDRGESCFNRLHDRQVKWYMSLKARMAALKA